MYFYARIATNFTTNTLMTEKSRYGLRGVSSDKEDVHAAIKNVDKGLFPRAFCKVIPDHLTGSEEHCVVMHADGAGTKSSLAYAYWRETGDLGVWKGIAQDAVVMNTDDLLCVGAVDNILLSSTIGRNKRLIPGEVVSAIINGTEEFLATMRGFGVNIVSTGGETADVGDLVRTVIVDSTVTARMRRADVVDNAAIKAGDLIVGLASFGQAAYETEYNGGMGSNGLTSARHDVFARYVAEKYPETYDTAIPEELAYSGGMRLTDEVDIQHCLSSEQGNFCADRSDEARDSTNGTARAENREGAKSALLSRQTAGKLVLSPTRTYAPIIVRALKECRGAIDGMVHCSGGGQTKILHFIDNLHVVKDNLFPTPPLFELIHTQSGTPWSEMYKVFNMGHRMELYVSSEAAAGEIIAISRSLGVDARVVGRVEAGLGDGARVSVRTPEGEFVYSK